MNRSSIPVHQTFGFERDPFRPDPAAVWLDERREEALEQLTDLVGRGGFGVLTGPPGCGKTMLLGHLCSQLAPTVHRIIYVACAECGPVDLMRLLCAGLDLEPSLGKGRMMRRVHDRVAEMKGITPVVVVDETQGLPQATLETLRVTCSGGLDGRSPFAVIMAGADELLGRLTLRVSEPLRQRITVYADVSALTRSQIVEYLRHRFETAGVCAEIVSAEALSLLFDATGGVPRQVDKLTAEALRRAAREGAASVALDHVQRAARTVLGPGAEVTS